VTKLGTIRSVEDYMAQLWSFGMFKGCFDPTKRRPSDIDGIVDAGGHLLVLEGKDEEDSGLDEGQGTLFRNLRFPRSIASLIWWGNPPSGPINRMRYDPPVPLLVPQRGTVGTVQPASLADLRAAVHEWHRWAASCAR
jgi:hypothetical protein